MVNCHIPIIYSTVIVQPWKIRYCEEVPYMCSRPLSEKWRRFRNIQPSHANRFVCCAHARLYSMVIVICTAIGN